MSNKPMSVLKLRNKKTGEVEQYEIVDEKARETLSELSDNKAEKTQVDGLSEEIQGKAEQYSLDQLDNKLTNHINEDRTSGVSVNGTTLVIRV